jgi:hypothetical protein
MSRITEPPSSLDGPAIIGVRPATPEWAENVARQASGVPPKGAREVKPEPAAPSEAPLPMIGVADAFVGRRIQQLREQAEGLEKSISRGCVGAGGVQVEYLVVQQRQARADVEQIREEIERIQNLDELAVRQLAYSLSAYP